MRHSLHAAAVRGARAGVSRTAVAHQQTPMVPLVRAVAVADRAEQQAALEISGIFALDGAPASRAKHSATTGSIRCTESGNVRCPGLATPLFAK
eukprot:CAMPEP_0176172900 /NCGR_PEP_ID=MMETSP0120_2-20121206/88586_1 /TAXON_ID=160619 /ORGANISM="Kryptoperidinium foliaceum, Strain CCMP 1326" /LENGTH=93 /DNA_ID=CAMNT_0017510905 /DNA_START=464 /DNA_END=746 /DNA_ORIENTATION=-